MTTTLLRFALLLGSFAAEPQPRLTVAGKTLVSEDFSGTELPKSFRVPSTPDSFNVVDGALQATWRAGQKSTTHGVFAISGHDLSIAFSMKFVDPGTLFIGVDGYNPMYQGNAHLVRFSLSPEKFVWDQKRGGPESKREVGAAMVAAREAKQPLPQPTAEQLADPKFFRTELLAEKPIDCTIGEWHHVLLEVRGNELSAQVDDKLLTATATVADAKKSRIGIALTGRGIVLIDNLRIVESKRDAD